MTRSPHTSHMATLGFKALFKMWVILTALKSFAVHYFFGVPLDSRPMWVITAMTSGFLLGYWQTERTNERQRTSGRVWR